MSENTTAREFFATYSRALLDRDAAKIADHYAVPGLIEFPGQRLAVSDKAQTEGFFAGAFDQYDGITDATAGINVVAETAHSIWADVTWSYDGAVSERSMYQLVLIDGEWKIGVLTPIEQ